MNVICPDQFALDIIALYDKVNNHIENIAFSEARKSRYLFMIRSEIRHYCRLSCINYNTHFKQKKALVVPSSHFLYFRFLALALAHLPLKELPGFLEYQFQQYDGNKLATREEFKIYLKEKLQDEVKTLSFSDTIIRLQTIAQWVDG
ncbi:MAG: hypothetical protein JWP12_823 [Bacteroidetes bacterium]|nr:hypothetical protein [Bacteroidota bacterium]